MEEKPDFVDFCLICKSERSRFELWQCSGRDHFFHDFFAGYINAICADVVIPDGVELATDVFCTNCLKEKDLTIEDVANSIAESMQWVDF